MGNTKKKSSNSRGGSRTSSRSSSSKSRGRTPASKREVTKVEHELPGGFWRQTKAVLMIVVAFLFILTWFGEGGSVLNIVHSKGLEYLGWAIYFVPILLVFLAVKIFRAKNNKLSPVVYLSTLLMLACISGACGLIMFGEGMATHGGIIGDFLNSYVRQLIDGTWAILIYAAIMFIDAIFILQMSPSTALNRMKKQVAVKETTDTLVETVEESRSLNKNKMDLKINNSSADSQKPQSSKTKTDNKPSKTLLPFKRPKLTKIKTNIPADAVIDSTPAKKDIPVSKPLATPAVSNLAPWIMPTTNLLEKKITPQDPGNIQQNAYIIQSTLSEFGIEVEMEGANVGPRVTQYTMKPPQGMNLSKISARDKELAMNLAVDKIRIEAPIPGTRSVGVEIPNVKSASVTLRSIIESTEWEKATDPLTFAVGKDISGRAIVANLADMPHLLIAGTTGSGKSVMTNALISSLIYRNSPDDLKLIIVDPKQVEMAQYEDIPHLLTPIITSTEKALSAMKWAAEEMDHRYNTMAEMRVKKIDDFNAKISTTPGFITTKDEQGNEVQKPITKMPYIVIVIDEMADLMMRASKELEPVIVRIAQLGRAAGIHLVLATQKPVVKVITGMIKGNIPARIAFRVNTSMDSRIILDVSGAEKLLGKGDMLLLTDKMMGKPCRIQGAWAYENEKGEGDIKNLTDFLKSQRQPEYNNDIIAQPVSIKGGSSIGGEGMEGLGRRYDPTDPVVRKAVEISLAKGKFSTAMLQTYLGKGHGYVSGLAIWFEEIGVIGEANGNKPREMLITSLEEFDRLANL